MFNMVITGSFITFCLIMLVKQLKVMSLFSEFIICIKKTVGEKMCLYFETFSMFLHCIFWDHIYWNAA